MQIKLTLSLPRDERSVPVARRIASGAMETLGVERECSADIELALTEACTNVLDHSLDDDAYNVTVAVEHELCIIEVVDTGHGFDGSTLGHLDAEPSAEQGRGIQLMRALVDKVLFTSREEAGTIVHLEKAIVWRENAPGRAVLAEQ